jgi:hypothetical protein
MIRVSYWYRTNMMLVWVDVMQPEEQLSALHDR